MNSILPYANLAVSWGLLILIWLVQLIIYPGFHRISPEGFAAYHLWYVKRIQHLVATNWIRTTAWSLKACAVSIYTISSNF